MKRFITVLAALVCCLTFSYAQKEFQGTITYTYDLKGENAEMMKMMMPEKMIMKYSDHGMITYMEGGMVSSMMGKVVVNAKSEEAFMIMKSEKIVYLLNPDEQEEAEEVDVETKKIEGEVKEILGYQCQKYELTSKQGGETTTQYIWATDKLKVPNLKVEGVETMNKALAFGGNIEGLPLLIEISLPQFDTQLIMKASELDKSELDAQEFEKPEGYETKDFSEFSLGKF
jgi:hypothetical protein